MRLRLHGAPAASLSHMGIYASGQAYEQLILHLLAHPLPEARAYGAMVLDAGKAVMPRFVSRVERPGRGDVWMGYLAERREAERRWVARLGLDRDAAAEKRPSVRLTHADGDVTRLLAALLYEAAGVPEERASARSCAPSSWASARTGATARAAASRRCATGSRSCPTTARSAICSATGC